MTLLEKFKKLTNISIKDFYIDLLSFYDNYHQDILNYYTDYNFDYPVAAFKKYTDILSRLEVIIEKVSLYKANFDNIEIWNLIEELDTMKLKLDNIPAYPRLYKIGFYKKQTDTDNQYETYIMKAHETLESVARDYNQNVTDLVLLNNLNEEKWTDKGGHKLILKSSISDAIPDLEQEESVFDILVGKNLLGKDLPNYFSIDEDNEDLLILTPEQTFLQAVQNLFQLKQGEIPEYVDLGINKEILGECTKSNMGYTFPILLRQLNITLESDDSILNFQIDNIELDESSDSYIVYASVQNRLYDNLKFSTKLAE